MVGARYITANAAARQAVRTVTSNNSAADQRTLRGPAAAAIAATSPAPASPAFRDLTKKAGDAFKTPRASGQPPAQMQPGASTGEYNLATGSRVRRNYWPGTAGL
jgi:hypothetical protein